MSIRASDSQPAERLIDSFSAPHDSLLRQALRRFLRHRLATSGVIVLAVLA
ncbi:MAG: hypothetical protein FJ038_04170, partial [Chloroflexi bacterium]|nr:hypothetical protein [Chloroflexota bacterium]